MGRYEGVLICSDFDGTLCYHQQVSKENLDAIREFEEKGGRFTLCTGRYPSVLETMNVGLSLHAPMICLNGAMIYDHTEKRILHEGYTHGPTILPALLRVREEMDFLEYIAVYTAIRDKRNKFLPHETDGLIEVIMSDPIYKVVIVCNKEREPALSLRKSALVKDRMSELLGPSFMVARSWPEGVEIQDFRYSKGKIARKLAHMLACDTLVCVGDYENDIAMLTEADLSFAVGNALDSVKEAAGHVLRPAADHAIAELISRL